MCAGVSNTKNGGSVLGVRAELGSERRNNFTVLGGKRGELASSSGLPAGNVVQWKMELTVERAEFVMRKPCLLRRSLWKKFGIAAETASQNVLPTKWASPSGSSLNEEAQTLVIASRKVLGRLTTPLLQTPSVCMKGCHSVPGCNSSVVRTRVTCLTLGHVAPAHEATGHSTSSETPKLVDTHAREFMEGRQVRAVWSVVNSKSNPTVQLICASHPTYPSAKFDVTG